MIRALFVVLALIAVSVAIPTAGSFETVYVVDAFGATQKDVLIYTRPGPPQTSSGSLKNSTILGGQRDISVTNAGTPNVFATSGVTNGFFFVDGCPFGSTCTGKAVLTYAGLNDAGIKIDFTLGNSIALAIDATSNYDARVLANITDVYGRSSSLLLTIPVTPFGLNYIPTVEAFYADFEGTADFTQVFSLSMTFPIQPAGKVKLFRIGWAPQNICCLYDSGTYGDNGFCESGAKPCPALVGATLTGSSNVQSCSQCTF